MYLFPVQISKRIHRPKAPSPLVIPLLRLRRSHHPFTINFQCQHTQFGVPLLKYIQRRNHAYRFCRQHCATLIVLPCVRLRDLKFHNDKRRLYTDTVPLNEPPSLSCFAKWDPLLWGERRRPASNAEPHPEKGRLKVDRVAFNISLHDPCFIWVRLRTGMDSSGWLFILAAHGEWVNFKYTAHAWVEFRGQQQGIKTTQKG